MRVEVKHAAHEDVGDVLIIANASNLGKWSRADYERELERADSIFLVAIAKNGQVAGFILGRVVPGSAAGSKSAELYNIGVSAEFRRCKVGSKLIQVFLETCVKKEVNDVFLEVRISNISALKFYEKQGFTTQYRRPLFYSNPTEDATVMRTII